tara:strand:- start:259 stop:762 length:504 start_codon:yes stop_codon:yes gene_type:complete
VFGKSVDGTLALSWGWEMKEFGKWQEDFFRENPKSRDLSNDALREKFNEYQYNEYVKQGPREEKQSLATSSSDGSKTKYPALKLISEVYRILAYIFILAGALCCGFGLSQKEMMLVGIGIFLTSVGPLTFFALAEGIIVFMDIEENTRRNAEAFRDTSQAERSEQGK